MSIGSSGFGKKREKRVIFAFLAMLLILATFAQVVYAARVVRPVPAYKQTMSNWCWAAVNKSIIQYYQGSSPTQTMIVSQVHGSPRNEGATLPQMKSSLAYWGVPSSIKYEPLTYTAVKWQLDHNLLVAPILLWWNPDIGGWSGHANLIRGYDESYDGVLFIDPWDGDYHGQNYWDYSDGVHYDGMHYYWGYSLFDTNL